MNISELTNEDTISVPWLNEYTFIQFLRDTSQDVPGFPSGEFFFEKHMYLLNTLNTSN